MPGEEILGGGPAGIFAGAIRGLFSDHQATPGGIFAQAILSTQVDHRVTRQDVLDVQSGVTSIAALRQRYGVDPPPPPPPPPPGPVNNPPIPQPSASSGYFVPGSIFWGSKGPRKRRRVKRPPTRVITRTNCETDTECEQWCFDNPQECEYWKQVNEARGPVVKIPQRGPSLPDLFVPTVGSRGTGTIAKRVRQAARVLGRASPLLWILYPSKLPRWDVIQPWEYERPDIMVEPRPQPIPKGPPQRPRVGRPYPYAWPLPDFQGRYRPRPRVPGVLYPDVDPVQQPGTAPAPATRPSPQPGTQPAARPVGDPFPRPGTRPGATPFPRPVPSPRTVPRAPDILPFLIPFLSPTPRVSRPAQPRRPPELVPSTPPIENPLTAPYRYRSDSCPPCESDRKRKRKKDSCTNPISGKRTFTRGGARYRTITRKLQCPV